MHSIRKPSTDGLALGRGPKLPRYGENMVVGRYRILGVSGRVSYLNGIFPSGKQRIDHVWNYRVACRFCGAKTEHTQIELREHETGKRKLLCHECMNRSPVGISLPAVPESGSGTPRSRASRFSAGDDPVAQAMVVWATPPSAVEEQRPCLR